jgi:Spy/CpxP family protein refolding chaperone
MSYLNLTDTQITALNTIRQQAFQALQTARQDIATKQKALSDLLAVGTTDASAVGKAVLEIQALHKKLADAQKPYQDQAVAVLTADQKTKLKALDDASKLQPAIQQAAGLLLLTPPQNFAPGLGPGPGRGPMGRGPGPGGPGMMRLRR